MNKLILALSILITSINSTYCQNKAITTKKGTAYIS